CVTVEKSANRRGVGETHHRNQIETGAGVTHDRLLRTPAADHLSSGAGNEWNEPRSVAPTRLVSTLPTPPHRAHQPAHGEPPSSPRAGVRSLCDPWSAARRATSPSDPGRCPPAWPRRPSAPPPPRALAPSLASRPP